MERPSCSRLPGFRPEYICLLRLGLRKEHGAEEDSLAHSSGCSETSYICNGDLHELPEGSHLCVGGHGRPTVGMVQLHGSPQETGCFKEHYILMWLEFLNTYLNQSKPLPLLFFYFAQRLML